MTSLGQTAASVRSRGVAGGAASTAAGNNNSRGAGGSPHFDDPYHQVSTPPRGASLAPRQPPSAAGLLGKGKGGKQASATMGPTSGISSAEWKLLAGIVVIAFIVRFWKIGQPSSVV